MAVTSAGSSVLGEKDAGFCPVHWKVSAARGCPTVRGGAAGLF
ncbi:MAG: hypothetical protein ACFFGZ_13650 [Candidatus Thorarchaeota archaeon]